MWITRVFLRFRRLGCFQFLFQLGNFPSSQMAIFFKIGIYLFYTRVIKRYCVKFIRLVLDLNPVNDTKKNTKLQNESLIQHVFPNHLSSYLFGQGLTQMSMNNLPPVPQKPQLEYLPEDEETNIWWY